MKCTCILLLNSHVVVLDPRILDFLLRVTQRVRVNGEFFRLGWNSSGMRPLSSTVHHVYQFWRQKAHLICWSLRTIQQWWACYAEMNSLALLPLVIFTTWCQEWFLVQNASKTKDMLIDFRLPHSSPVSTAIDGQNIGTVESCEYFWTIFDSGFNFE